MARKIILDSAVSRTEYDEVKKKYGTRRLLSVTKDSDGKLIVRLKGGTGR